MTHAIVYTEFGSPDVLTLVEIPDREPADGEIAVRVEAAGVNPIDGKLRSGRRASGEITEPRRVGGDAAGIVAAVGAGVEGFRVGDAVVVFGAPGAYASRVIVRAENAQPLLPGVTAAEGAALGVPVGTAYQSLRSLAVGAGDTLLLHGGSGAVGQAAIQFAVLWGATVIATASERRFARIRALGATPVAYGDGLVDRVRDAAPQGVTVALDAAGTDEAIEASLELVADRERIATIVRGRDAATYGIRAFQGGAPAPLSERALGWRREAIPVAIALMAAGRFSVELGPSLPLADAAEAHRAVENGTDGKITLVP
jgi:enoyl reductase